LLPWNIGGFPLLIQAKEDAFFMVAELTRIIGAL